MSNTSFQSKVQPGPSQSPPLGRPITPASLHMAGHIECKEHWTVTLEVLADDLLVYLGRSSSPSTINVSLLGMPPAPAVIEARHINSLFKPRGWHGAISGEGNAGILAVIDGFPSAGRSALHLSFVKHLDDNLAFRIQGPAACFAICACRAHNVTGHANQDVDVADDTECYVSRIRQRLRAERLKRSYSLQRMASLCGITKTTLGELERGKRRITLAHLFKLSAALDVPLSELVTP